MTPADRSLAYARLTREVRTMHHTERDILDAAPNLDEILLAVHEHRELDAIELTQAMHTERGDAWRTKQNIRYRTNGVAVQDTPMQTLFPEALREDWARGRVAAAGKSWATHLAKFDGTVLER